MNGTAVEKAARTALAANGLPSSPLRRLPGGFRNTVYRAGRHYVIRLNRRPAHSNSLWRGAVVRARVEGVMPVPRPVASGVAEGFVFEISEYADGAPLSRVWPHLSRPKQARLVDELATLFLNLRKLPCTGFGWPGEDARRHATWLEFINSELEQVTEPPAIRPIARALAAAARELTWEETPHLVHNDLLMTNVLVREECVLAVLDWELAMHAPADLELHKLEGFCRRPGVVHARGDFTGLWQELFQRLAPSLPVDELSRRLRVYDLFSEWRVLRYRLTEGLLPERVVAAALRRLRPILTRTRRYLAPLS